MVNNQDIFVSQKTVGNLWIHFDSRSQALERLWNPVGPVTARARRSLHMARAKQVRAKVNFEIPANLADASRDFSFKYR